jgi:hypothetical protein
MNAGYEFVRTGERRIALSGGVRVGRMSAPSTGGFFH